MASFRVLSKAVLVLALAHASAAAEKVEVPNAAASNSALAEQCSRALGSLAQLACELARALLPAATGAEVVVVELKSDTELPAPAALRERVREVVAGALSNGTVEPARQRTGLRVALALEVRSGRLGISADARPRTRLWERSRARHNTVELHAYAARPIDFELRRFVPAPPLVVTRVLKARAPERGIVAMACGDVGADHTQELVLVSRSHVRLGRLAGGEFSEGRRTTWQALSSVAPAPLREPIAFVDITASGRLRVGSSDRSHGLLLDAELVPTERYPNQLPLAEGCVERAGMGFESYVRTCAESSSNYTRAGDAGAGVRGGARERPAGAVLDAVASFSEATVGRLLEDGSLLLISGASSTPLLASAGAQLAVGDADGDGAPEIAVSRNTLDPTNDGLSLFTLEQGKLRLRFELAAPSISAIAVCRERDGAGMAPIVLASADEIWIVK
jgi:hypothetical protein